MATKPTTVTTLDAGRRVFTNLKYLHFIPWTDESTPGTTAYDLVNIVGDTTSVEQAENNVNALDHEFSNEPLYENIILGTKTFSTECIDFQNPVLGELMGWETDEAGNAFAPNAYKDLYVWIEMGFNSTDDIVVLPKVKFNSTATLASMKTDASRGMLTGTCYSAYMTAGELEGWTDEAAVAAANKTTYTVAAVEPGTGA